MLRQKVTVRVPATTANMGPGYDCIGLAVDLWNELTVERASKFSMHIEGEGAEAIPRTKENFVVKGLELAFAKAGKPVPELAYFCKNGIPFGSGLGSSSAGIVSGLLAGAVLAGLEMDVTVGVPADRASCGIGHVAGFVQGLPCTGSAPPATTVPANPDCCARSPLPLPARMAWWRPADARRGWRRCCRWRRRLRGTSTT